MTNDDTPPPPSTLRSASGAASRPLGMFLLLGVGVVAAIAAAIHFKLIPLRGTATAAPAESTKLVVGHVTVTPEGQRGPGPAYIAEVRGEQEFQLSFETGGVIDLIGPAPGKTWDEGTPVREGTVLAQLKSGDFTNRLKAAQARAELARTTHERFQNLFKSQSIPRQQLDQAVAEKQAAEADLVAAERAVKATRLLAPEDGTIIARLVTPAETVGPGRPVVRFANLRFMIVEVGVPDTLVGRIAKGQEIPVEFSAIPGQVFPGRVAEVAVAGEAGLRLFKVKVRVPNQDGKVKAGMTASVSFRPPGDASRPTLWIPLIALTTAGNNLAVYVIDADQTARRRVVETDDIAGNRVMVTRGLQAGDKVVVLGVSTLYDGAPVEARLVP